MKAKTRKWSYKDGNLWLDGIYDFGPLTQDPDMGFYVAAWLSRTTAADLRALATAITRVPVATP